MRLYFTITGKFVTQHARDFWVEGNEHKAIAFLVENLPGVTPEQALQVCTGKAKFTGEAKLGDENSCVFLEDDNIITHRNMPLLQLQEAFARKDQIVKQSNDEVRDATEDPVGRASPWGYISIPPRINDMLLSGKIDWDSPKMRPYQREPYISKTPSFLSPPDITDVKMDAIVDDLANTLPKSVHPKPDKELNSLNGWIDRRGRFFPCEYQGHIELADLLGDGERELEKQGWIKVSDSQRFALGLPDISVDPDFKGATQSQIDTVFGWCQKHGRKFPKDFCD